MSKSSKGQERIRQSKTDVSHAEKNNGKMIFISVGMAGFSDIGESDPKTWNTKGTIKRESGESVEFIAPSISPICFTRQDAKRHACMMVDQIYDMMYKKQDKDPEAPF